MHGFLVKTQAKKNGFYLVFFDPAIFIGLQYATGLFVDRGVGKVDVLLQVAYGIGFGNVNGAAVQAFLAKNHLEQGGLSTTIAPYQTNPLVVAHK